MEKLVVILGPTASGKTTLAAHFAQAHNGEIISADSRQVYKKMDIGTGKDLEEYIVNDKKVPYHLIDICSPGEKYLLPDFQRDFSAASRIILKNKNLPILCGGTGLYIEAILQNHQFTQIPENEALRSKTRDYSHQKLLQLLAKEPKILGFEPDKSTRKRTLRALEMSRYLQKSKLPSFEKTNFDPILIGINIERELRRNRITNRLQYRLKNGLIEEVEELIKGGVSAKQLKYYGLEYKYITEYLEGQYSRRLLFDQLEIAIHQFAKRQMTWFRRMEKNGHQINWIDANLPLDKKINQVETLFNSFYTSTKNDYSQ